MSSPTNYSEPNKLASVFAETQNELRAIDFASPEEPQVLAFLNALRRQLVLNNISCITVDEFYSPEAFDQWRKLLTMEAAEGYKTPPNYNSITPFAMFLNALIPFTCEKMNKTITTFADRVERASYLRKLWSAESKEASRSARLNREAQYRHRMRLRDDGSPEAEHAKLVKQTYEEYLYVCRQRKETETMWNDRIKEVTAQLREEQRRAIAEWDKAVGDRKTAWESLKGKTPGSFKG